MNYVSLFHGIDPTPCQTWSLTETLATIGNGMHRHTVEQCRLALAHDHQNAYTQLKKALPSFTPAGTFLPTRGNAHLQEHSGVVHFDIDHLSQPGETKQTLLCVGGLAYIFVSPSGTGLKLGIRTPSVADDRAYKHVWGCLATQLSQHYGLTIDASGKDVSRLCFASHDPNIYVNLTAPMVDVPPIAAHAPDMVTLPSHRTEEPLPHDRVQRYVATALRNAETILDRSSDGTRHACRLRAGRLLGGYCTPEFGLTQSEALALLEAAVLRNTQTPDKALRTMQAALAYGAEQPITLGQLEAERLAWKGGRA